LEIQTKILESGNPKKINKNKKISEIKQKKVFVWIVDPKSEKSRKPKQKSWKSKQKFRNPNKILFSFFVWISGIFVWIS
jgi:hypothetical protein